MTGRPGPLAAVRIGCSGWQYRHWRADFYPPALPQRLWLEHYAGTFDTVEINNSFYRLPAAETFAAWRERVPRGFLFAVKASRYLTHMRKLKDPEAPLNLFFERATALGPRLGPVLYQLPPGWRKDVARLAGFVGRLPPRRLHAIEFREPSWYADDALAVLDKRNVTLCLHDMPGSASGRTRVGGFAYVRFHGSGAKYGGGYPESDLREWARWIHGERRAGRQVYAYFNNDVGGHAPRDAVRLRSMVT
ncbi:MAG TPA: DUF72 domain-containing protein [Vicinamibacterales bacterium]|nr:DUF72 domain-containing protein [Vicinamibacterales bacterium]